VARFLLRRASTALLALFVLTIVAFLLAEVIPGDPARTYAGPGATPEAVAAARDYLGLNRSLIAQYWTYLARLVQGNFGISVFTHRPIAQDLATALPPSIELVAIAMVLNIVIGVPLGVIAAARPGGVIDGFTRLIAMIGAGVPPFFLAILLQYVFAYRLGILPLTGEAAVNANLGSSITGFPLIDTLLHGNLAGFGDVVGHLILPALALAAGFSGVIMRTVRSSMLGTLGEEYVVLARAKGLSERRVLIRHALRNALLPSLTILGMQVGWMLGSTILVETVYSYPGIGNYAVTALFNSDLWAVVGVVFVIGAVFIIANFLTDVVQMLLDPGVRARRLGVTA
jgi:ABC-type dipeptide/oligopeptide/nickel transport system permease component